MRTGETNRWLNVTVGEATEGELGENTEDLVDHGAAPGLGLELGLEEEVAEVTVVVVLHCDIRELIVRVPA